MKTRLFSPIIPLALLFALLSPAIAEETSDKPAAVAAAVRPLKVEGAKIEKLRHYLGGFGNTQMFIRIPGQKAIVHLNIDHTNRDFATTGKVVLFAADADDESIDKWINNQHSCGLFPDVAEPVFTGKLPDGSCTVTERKKIGEAAGPTDNAPFHDYQVKLAVKAHTEPGQYTLEAFETEAEVYLKITTL
jgi:hypothetical protein